jgi:hypothetical protein
MGKTAISIQVDAETASIFSALLPQERRKLELLLDLRLRELLSAPTRPLREIMDDIGQRAESLGLTPEKLNFLLDEE